MDLMDRLARASALPPEEILFWSGAGISAPPPTSLPLGNRFTELAIEQLTLPSTSATLERYFAGIAAAGVLDSSGQPKRAPRLELVLGSLEQVLGARALEILRPTADAPPNGYHEFFGRHLGLGGHHWTMNFDGCIEHGRPAADARRLKHVHGRYSSATLDGLGATISQVARGLPDDTIAQLHDRMARTRVMVFVGYSGSDYFDVTPAFRRMAAEGLDLRHLDVLWLRREPGAPRLVPAKPGGAGHAMLLALQRAGADACVVEGDPVACLDAIASNWGVPPISFDPAPSPALPSAPIPVTDDERLLATAHLLVTMGIGQEVLERTSELARLARRGPRRQRSLALHALAAANRDRGRYRVALRWADALPRRTAVERADRHHQLADSRWLRGDHLHAWWHFHRASRLLLGEIRRCDARGESAVGPRRAHLSLAITRMHWLRDVIRWVAEMDGLAFIAVGIRSTLAWPILREALATSAQVKDSPHDTGKLVRLWDELDGAAGGIELPPEIASSSAEVLQLFHETDSLTGMVNFLRRDLLKAWAGGHPPDRSDVQRLLELAVLNHDAPGEIKARMLMHALFDSDWPEFRARLRQVEWNVLMRSRVERRWASRRAWDDPRTLLGGAGRPLGRS